MNKKLSKSNYYVLLAVVFIGFFVFGISENIKGPAIPRMQTDFELSEKDIGLLLSLNALGYMLACSFTAWLSRKKGIKQITVLSFIVMTLSGVFIYLADSYQAFSLSYFMMYIGNGMLEIILAILAARIFINNTGMMMNLAHFFYGLSSIIAPICAAYLMQLSLGGRIMGWRGMYLIMLALCIVPILPALKGRFPDENEEKRQHVSWKKFLREPVAWLTVSILSFGTMAELAVGGWLVNYIEKVLDWEPTAASGMLSLFFIAFTASRLILGRMTDKLGYIKSLILFSAVSGILTFIAILGGAYMVFLLPLSGMGIAIIYPTVMAFLAKYYKEDSDIAISYTVTAMGIFLVVGNYFIGFITDVFSRVNLIVGLKAGYLVIGICALISSLGAVLLYGILKKRNEVL